MQDVGAFISQTSRSSTSKKSKWPPSLTRQDDSSQLIQRRISFPLQTLTIYSQRAKHCITIKSVSVTLSRERHTQRPDLIKRNTGRKGSVKGRIWVQGWYVKDKVIKRLRFDNRVKSSTSLNTMMEYLSTKLSTSQSISVLVHPSINNIIF